MLCLGVFGSPDVQESAGLDASHDPRSRLCGLLALHLHADCCKQSGKHHVWERFPGTSHPWGHPVPRPSLCCCGNGPQSFHHCMFALFDSGIVLHQQAQPIDYFCSGISQCQLQEEEIRMKKIKKGNVCQTINIQKLALLDFCVTNRKVIFLNLCRNCNVYWYLFFYIFFSTFLLLKICTFEVTNMRWSFLMEDNCVM